MTTRQGVFNVERSRSQSPCTAPSHARRSFEVFLRVFLCPSTVAAAQSLSLSFSLVAALLCSSCTPTAPLPPTVGRQFSLSESDGQVIRHSNPSKIRRKRSQREVFRCSRKPLSLPCLLRSKKCRKTALSRRLSLFYFRPASLGNRLLYFGKLVPAVLPPSSSSSSTDDLRHRAGPMSSVASLARSLMAATASFLPLPPSPPRHRPPDAAAATACRSPLRSLGQAKVRGERREHAAFGLPAGVREPPLLLR